MEIIKKKINGIQIHFENCDYVYIEKDHIIDLQLNDLKNREYSAWNTYEKCIEKYCYMESKDIGLTISKGADKKYFEFGINDNEFDNHTVFSRLQTFKDIVAFTILYEGKTKEDIYVDWCDENEHTNYHQKTVVNDEGDLVIMINKENHIECQPELRKRLRDELEYILNTKFNVNSSQINEPVEAIFSNWFDDLQSEGTHLTIEQVAEDIVSLAKRYSFIK